jgi:hypothetical protein
MPESDVAAAAVSFAIALGLAEYWAGIDSGAQGLDARITQDDPSIAVWLGGVNVMATQGCFFRADLGIAETRIDRPLTAAEINAIRVTTQTSAAVNPDMSVVPGRAADVLNAAFMEVGNDLTASIAGGTGYTGPADATEFRGILLNGRQHWREGDSGGDVIWDPYPGLQFQTGRTSVDQVYFLFAP